MPLKYSCSAHTAQNCWLWMTWDSLWRVLPNSLMRKGFHWTFGGLVIAHAISSGLGCFLSTFHLYIFLRTLWLGCGSVCTIMTCGKPFEVCRCNCSKTMCSKSDCQILLRYQQSFGHVLLAMVCSFHVSSSTSTPDSTSCCATAGCPWNFRSLSKLVSQLLLKLVRNEICLFLLWQMLILFWNTYQIDLDRWTREKRSPLPNVKVGRMRSWF